MILMYREPVPVIVTGSGYAVRSREMAEGNHCTVVRVLNSQ